MNMCPACSRPLPAGSPACPACGAPWLPSFQKSSFDLPAPRPEPQPWNRLNHWLGSTILGLALFLGGTAAHADPPMPRPTAPR